MTIQEILKQLIESKNYPITRNEIANDDLINMVKTVLVNDYELIREKEEKYQKQLELFNSLK